MRSLFTIAAIALGALAFFILVPSPAPQQTGKPATTKTPSSNRSLITSLKRQLAEEEEALARSLYNYRRTSGDVTKGTAADSPENRARAARISELRNRLAALE